MRHSIGSAAEEGLKASFEEAVERRHFAALNDGDDAVDHHREVLKLDPNFIDAGLTVGLYEYVVGSLPLPIKVVAGITGFRGSKKKGLAMIERVAKEGQLVARRRQDASDRSLHPRETLCGCARPRARAQCEVSAQLSLPFGSGGCVGFPGRGRTKNKNIEAAVKAEREAFATFDDLLHDRSVRDTVSRALDLVHFKYGEVLLTAGEGERAAKEFLAATKSRTRRAYPGYDGPSLRRARFRSGR